MLVTHDPLEVYNDGRFQLIEGPCGRLDQVPDGWADAVVTSPSFNLGHGPHDFTDRLPERQFEKVLQDMVYGASRVLAMGGLLIVDATLWVGHAPEPRIRLSDFIGSLAHAVGLQTVAKFHYESVEHEPFANRGHSAREAVIAYSMLPAKTAIDSRLRPSYRFGEHQPEDVWPSDLVADLISTFGLVGKKVVDPFAGEAALPLEVYRLGGKVVCFEISRSRAQIIRDRLAQLDKCDD